MRILLKFAAIWLRFAVACRALLWLFVERQNFNAGRDASKKAEAQNAAERKQHSDPADLDADLMIAHRMVVALGIALLGSTGVYFTTIELDSEPQSRGVGMTTAAAVSRAGAIISVTRVDFEERSAQAETGPYQSRRQRVSPVDGSAAEYRMASRGFVSARHHCLHAHGPCRP
jgi:hypothetical protein